MSIMLADALAIIAVVLSAGSLGAQVGSYLFSGPVVRVTGFTYSGFGKPTQPGGPMERVTKGTLLTATNKGRAPVTVNSVGISFSSRFPPSLLILEDPRAAGPKLPYRLEPSSDAQWVISKDVGKFGGETQRKARPRAAVRLGDGRIISRRVNARGWLGLRGEIEFGGLESGTQGE
jgi:hypothetical protein